MTVAAGAEAGTAAGVDAPTAAPGSASGGGEGRRSGRWRVVLLLATSLGCAACGLIYELGLLNLAGILVGSSVQTTSLVLGVFVCAMGVGSLLSKPLAARPLAAFVGIEATLAVVGGVSGPALYAAFAWFEMYEVAALGFAVAVGALIGAEIPLLMALVGRLRTQRASDDAADVMAADYVGALVAGLAFPFLLVPSFGLVRTSLVAGLVNLVLAGGAVAAAGTTRRRAGVVAGVLLVAGGLLAAGLWRAGDWVVSVRQRLYDEPIVAAEQTPYQEIVVTRSSDGRDLRLFLDGDLQFSSVDEYRYHEALVHPAMDGGPGGDGARRVLILGGGDGLAAREVLRHGEVDEVVQVDLDPAVTRLARDMPELVDLNEGALGDPRLRLVHDDAFGWVADRARSAPGSVDVVIVDLPDPDRFDLVRLYSEEMYRGVHALLAPEGRMVVQAGSPYFAREAFWSVDATVRAAGFATVPYHVDVPSFGDWGFVLATAVEPVGSVGSVGSDDLRLDADLGTRFLTPDVLDAARVFGADVGRVPVEVNTVDNPVLLDYTQRGWSQY
jgi:spermidine synthase